MIAAKMAAKISRSLSQFCSTKMKNVVVVVISAGRDHHQSNATHHQARLVEHVMQSLGHIRRVSVVVIQVAVFAVSGFRLSQKRLQRARGDLKGMSHQRGTALLLLCVLLSTRTTSKFGIPNGRRKTNDRRGLVADAAVRTLNL